MQIRVSGDHRVENQWSFQVDDLRSGSENVAGWNYLSRQYVHFDMNTDIFTIVRQIVDDKVIKLMVEQTNIYGRRLKENASNEFCRIKRWIDNRQQSMKCYNSWALYFLRVLSNYPHLRVNEKRILYIFIPSCII